MTAAPGSIPPPISWAQRYGLLYVIIDVECRDIDYKVTKKTFSFKGVNALDPSKKYDVVLNFLHEVDPEKVTSKNIGRCLEFTILKKECGPYWPSLTSDKTKLHFLKANFAKWKDEDDDEEDEENAGSAMNFNSLMGSNPTDFKDLDFDVDDDSDDAIPSLSKVDDEDDVDDDDDEEEEEEEKKNKTTADVKNNESVKTNDVLSN